MTERRRKFMDAWLGEARYNATKAARLAGYSWPNKQGPALMQHPAVGPPLRAEFLKRFPGVARLEAEWRAYEERVAAERAAKDRRNARDRARRAQRRAVDEPLSITRTTAGY